MDDKSTAKPEIRDVCVKAYFTSQDAEFLSEVAKGLGMSRSSLIVAIMERMIVGGFSIRGAAQLTAQLQRRARERGVNSSQGFYFGIRPLPPLPEEDLTTEDETMILEELNQLKKC
jgi:hypothetical protein